MDSRARLRVTLLGELAVSRGDVLLHVPGTRLRSLLVWLALAGGRAVEPAVLVDAVWGDEPPSSPSSALQMLVSRLRRALGPGEVVVRAEDGYRLAVDAADVDVPRFEGLVASGRRRLSAGHPAAAAATLAEALALWGDRPGSEPAVVAAVAPATAVRLARASIDAAIDLADAELALGQAEAAEGRLTGVVHEQQVHERAAALLMDALTLQGRQAEALALYEQVRAHLADLLGADPGSALRERHLRLLRSAPHTTAPARQSTLPESLTSFVGRDEDLARITALLTSRRLVTVLGTGGAGKTRLAVEAARRHESRDGTWMIDLASVAEPAKTAGAVLAGIGLRGGAMLDARKPREGDELDLLVGELSGRECLLLVDNCEHVIDVVAHLVVSLLTRCPGLRVLATSREPLAVDGEVLVPLGPLALPEPHDGVEQARAAASVRLFTERAAAVRPGFEVDETTLSDVVRIVRGLDGMPLALELAAARLRTLSLTELADGLSDRFRLLATGSRTAVPRHRTLHAVVAWSWNLLGEHERTVAERISVLPGGITSASAAAVCAGTGVPAAEVPGLLAALVDRSLLQLAAGAGRHRMLETIREYGVSRLTENGELDSTRDLASAHSIAVMAHHEARLRGPGQLAALRDINAEHHNALAALRHLCVTHDSAGAITLALSLVWFWEMSGRHTDGSDWLSEVLALPCAEPTPERDCALAVHLINRADSLSGIASSDVAGSEDVLGLAHRLLSHRELPGQYRVFGPVLLFLHDQESALDHFRRLADGDEVWLAGLAHLFQAEIAENSGDLEQTRRHVDAALNSFGRAGDSWGRAAVLSQRARLRRYDDLDGTVADLREAETLADEFGSLSLADRLHRDLRWTDLYHRRGEIDRAVELIDSARQRATTASSAEMLVVVDARDAELRVRLGDLDKADELLVNAERGLRGANPHTRTLVSNARATWCLATGDVPGSEAWLSAAHEAALSTRELPTVSLVTVTSAARAESLGQHHEAVVLLGAAARLRGTHDRTDPQILELTRRGREVLGEKEFSAAYADGWELSAEEACRLSTLGQAGL